MHSFLTFVSANGMLVKEAVQIALFFAHQCNGTVMFTEAMKRLTITHRPEVTQARKDDTSMYFLLGKICLEIGGRSHEDLNLTGLKDVGASKQNRYQPSNNLFWEESTVLKTTDDVICMLHEAHGQMLSNRKSNSDRVSSDYGRLKIVQRLSGQIQSALTGFGNLRSQALIQLSSLFGLISLDFYTYIPMHLSGGPGKFLRDSMHWEQSEIDKTSTNVREIDSLLRWNAETVVELQHLYNRELTHNFFENGTCEITRRLRKYDHYYYLPWVQHGNPLKISEDKLQLFFRVNGRRSSKWMLEAFDGKRKFIIFSDSDTESSLLRWERSGLENRIRPTTKLVIQDVVEFNNIYK